MTAAYETALVMLRLSDRDDPITEIVAMSIVSVIGLGEHNPAIAAERAINALGISRSDAAYARDNV